MAVARKHHYLPQMYLTGFANDKDQCFVVDASTRKAFTSSTAKIAKEQDYNTIEIQGVPADALEKELGKLEGVIAPGIKRVRETASFGASGENREDIINLITLLAVRNPCARHDMGKLYTELLQAMVAMPFEDPARWDAVVEQLTAAGQWPEGAPVDFDGYKNFVEENKDKLKPHQNFTLAMELEAIVAMYPYFDARKWWILKATDDSGGFVTTDHPVCVHRPGGLNYGQQFAPGLGLTQLSQLGEKSEQHQRRHSGSFHYTALVGRRAMFSGAVIRGGFCGGRSSLSWRARSFWSAVSSV
jgi:hypothetical protein